GWHFYRLGSVLGEQFRRDDRRHVSLLLKGMEELWFTLGLLDGLIDLFGPLGMARTDAILVARKLVEWLPEIEYVIAQRQKTAYRERSPLMSAGWTLAVLQT